MNDSEPTDAAASGNENVGVDQENLVKAAGSSWKWSFAAFIIAFIGCMVPFVGLLAFCFLIPAVVLLVRTFVAIKRHGRQGLVGYAVIGTLGIVFTSPLLILALGLTYNVVYGIRNPDPYRLGRACCENLYKIDAALEQWALENSRDDGSTTTIKGLTTEYFKKKPICPAGGTYPAILTVGVEPTCSMSGVEGHTLRDDY